MVQVFIHIITRKTEMSRPSKSQHWTVIFAIPGPIDPFGCRHAARPCLLDKIICNVVLFGRIMHSCYSCFQTSRDEFMDCESLWVCCIWRSLFFGSKSWSSVTEFCSHGVARNSWCRAATLRLFQCAPCSNQYSFRWNFTGSICWEQTLPVCGAPFYQIWGYRSSVFHW